MAKFEVTTEIVLYCPVKLIVEAQSKDDALDAASALIPINIQDAATTDRPWKAAVEVKPPQNVQVVTTRLKAVNISATSGGEKVRKIG